MSFDASSILLDIMTSAIGFALFTYGRKQARLPQVIGGIALMAYPYFVSSYTSLLIIGVLICVAVWLALRMGY
jgi:hypothetical protein